MSSLYVGPSLRDENVNFSCVTINCCASLADSRVPKFAKWSIVYFSALLDCPVYLKQYSTCWAGVSLGHFAIATKVY